MQQTGTLKKRRRRNLAKVNGLGTVPYDENEDCFTGRELFGSQYRNSGHPKSFVTLTGQDTRLRFSSAEMVDHRREASRTRVTRDPSYHDFNVDDDLDDPFSNWDAAAGSEEFVGLGPFDKRRNVPDSIKDRHHFLNETSMQRLKALAWLGITSFLFPWKWNEENFSIDRWSPVMEKIWWVQWFAITVQSTSIMIFQAFTFRKTASEASTYREVFMSSYSLLWYVWTTYYNVNMFIYKERMRNYINTMLEFNRKHVEKFLIHLDDFLDEGRLVINIAILSNMSQVFVSISFLMRMPFMPWYVFSFIYPKPWYWLIPGAMQEYIMVGQVITSTMFITWIVVVHTNTVQFWLREIHNHNDSDYTSDDLRTPKASFETYKALLVLNKVFNDCMAPLAIPLVKITLFSAMIPCGYVLIRSMNHIFVDEFPGILTYPISLFDCSTSIFAIMSMSAGVFDLGCSFIDSWSRTKQKDFRRVLMSCPSMKVWVGGFYFMTVSTTISFFKVTFDYVIDCIITFPEK